MTDESIFLIAEVWLRPDRFDDFKSYRQKTMDIMIKHHAEYVYHGHPFEWIHNPDNEPIPTGMEVFRFPSAGDADRALEELNDPSLQSEMRAVFDRVRMYKSKYAISHSWNSE